MQKDMLCSLLAGPVAVLPREKACGDRVGTRWGPCGEAGWQRSWAHEQGPGSDGRHREMLFPPDASKAAEQQVNTGEVLRWKELSSVHPWSNKKFLLGGQARPRS